MCLNYSGLKTYDDNNKVRIGYKIFYKTPTGYENRFFNDYNNKHRIGEWVKNKPCKNSIECRSYYNKQFKLKYYKAGFHFYSTKPNLDNRYYEIINIGLRIIECICENITTTGRQDNKSCFVAQSYRLMREVK